MGLGLTKKQLGMVAVLLAGTFVAVSNATASDLSEAARTFAGYHASFSVTAGLALIAVVIIVSLVRNPKRAGTNPTEDR